MQQQRKCEKSAWLSEQRESRWGWGGGQVMGQGKKVGVNLKPGGALVGKLSRGMAQCNPTQGALATVGLGWPDPWVGDRE